MHGQSHEDNNWKLPVEGKPPPWLLFILNNHTYANLEIVTVRLSSCKPLVYRECRCLSYIVVCRTTPIQTQQLVLNGTIFTVYNQFYQFVTSVHETSLSVSAAKFVYELIFGRSGLGL